MAKTAFPDIHKPAVRAFLASPAGLAFVEWAKTPDVPDFTPSAASTIEAAALNGAYASGFRKVLTSLQTEIAREKRQSPTPIGPGSVA